MSLVSKALSGDLLPICPATSGRSGHDIRKEGDLRFPIGGNRLCRM